MELKIGDKRGCIEIVGGFFVRKGHKMYSVKCDCGNHFKMGEGTFMKQERKYCLKCSKRPKTIDQKNARRLNSIWGNMKERCHNINHQNYPHYGGRGIFMCDEWFLSLNGFRRWALSNGYQSGLTIDRIDNNKGYSPDNCRWVTMKEQGKNTRRNVWYEVDGKKMLQVEVCEKYNITDGTLYARLKSGMSIEQALKTPIKKQVKKKKRTRSSGELSCSSKTSY